MQRDQLFLAEIIETTRRIIELTEGYGADDLESDRDRREALLWNFTVLGEAAGSLSEEARSRYAPIDWSGPFRLRNRIVHGYWSADLEVLLATARNDLPLLLETLRTGPSEQSL